MKYIKRYNENNLFPTSMDLLSDCLQETFDKFNIPQGDRNYFGSENFCWYIYDTEESNHIMIANIPGLTYTKIYEELLKIKPNVEKRMCPDTKMNSSLYIFPASTTSIRISYFKYHKSPAYS